MKLRTIVLLFLFIAGSILVFSPVNDPALGIGLTPLGSYQVGDHPIARRDDAALKLIRLSLAKMGPLAGNGRDTIATGTFKSFRDGTTSPLTMKTHGTDYIRNEVGDFTFIRSGFSGKTHYGGKDHPVAYHAVAYKRAEHIPALLLLSEVESPALQCIMVGPEEVNGVSTSHIRLSVVPEDSSDPQAEDLISETHVWIDQQGFVLKARIFIFSPEIIQNRSPVDLYYSDYRQVGDFLLPFHINREISGHKDAEIAFTSIDINAKLSPADFQ